MVFLRSTCAGIWRSSRAYNACERTYQWFHSCTCVDISLSYIDPTKSGSICHGKGNRVCLLHEVNRIICCSSVLWKYLNSLLIGRLNVICMYILKADLQIDADVEIGRGRGVDDHHDHDQRQDCYAVDHWGDAADSELLNMFVDDDTRHPFSCSLYFLFHGAIKFCGRVERL